MSKLSIITVNYHSQAFVDSLKDSLRHSHFKDYEFIAIDNDSNNIGFGAANNQGYQKARGEYLFFLNPDTQIFPDTLDTLVNFLDSHPNAAIASPVLVRPNSQLYESVGSSTLTPIRGIFALSFLNKLWPQNPISKNYWIETKKLDKPTQVGVVPGTAFVIRKSIFKKIHGFDPKFFMYFEESDLCKRVNDLGYDVYLLPQAKIVHHGGKSTPESAYIKHIFASSRFYYFRKHFGFFSALVVEFFAHLSLKSASLAIILSSSLTLLLWKFNESTQFIGDQAWFFLSARDALLTGKLPLLGVTTSITWLHQGAVFTYLLIPALVLGSFNPVFGSYLTITFGFLSVILFYFLAKRFFGLLPALLSSAVLATWPFFIYQSRFSYHTAPIPLFTLIFLTALVRYRFTIAALFLAFLYQLHLLTFIFWPIYVAVVGSKFRFKSLAVFLFGISPLILSGPIQTLGIFAWLVKQVFSGFTAVSGGSYAYIMVLIAPMFLALAGILKLLPRKAALLICAVFILNNLLHRQFISSNSYKLHLDLARQIFAISSTNTPQIKMTGVNSEYKTTSAPYEYFIWWLSRFQDPAGRYSQFEINESDQTFRVLK